MKKPGPVLRIALKSVMAGILLVPVMPLLDRLGVDSLGGLADVELVLAIVQAETAESAAAAVHGVGAQVIEEMAAVKAVGTRLTPDQHRRLSRLTNITAIWINQTP